MKICKNCGKEYTGRNKVYCSQKCRAEYLKNLRTCVVCGKKFWSSPSSEVITCSRECESVNRIIVGKSEKNLKILAAARESATKSPHIGNFDTNIHAKSWGLVSPEGRLYEVSNLSKWCHDNQDIIPYSNPKTFVTQLYKIKSGKVSSAAGWTLKWCSDVNFAREGLESPKHHPKRTKMTDSERLERKRERAREYYRRKKSEAANND